MRRQTCTSTASATWPTTSGVAPHGGRRHERPSAIGRLRLDGIPEPIVDAQGFPDDPELLALVASVAQQLPDACAGQVATGIDRALPPWFDVVESVALRGMVLARPDRLAGDGVGDRLGMDEYPQLWVFLDATVDAEGFLGPDMVTTGHYLGSRDGSGALVAVAGVHPAEKSHGVAVIGNVVTHPDHRGRGLARVLVTRLARALHETYPGVGLNCRAENIAAMRLCGSLGFGPYGGHALVHQRFVRRV